MKVPLSIRVIPAFTWRAWITPPPVGSKTLLRDQEATADLTSFLAGEVTGFEVGSGPLVLALHGWGGRPAQMAPIARRLADEGFRVVIPELPGRAGGEPTDIKKVAAVIRHLIDQIGVPEVVVAHSFASMVMRLVFSDEGPRLAVLVAPSLDVHDALEAFGDRLRLLPWARSGLRKRLESFDPNLWPTMAAVQVDHMSPTEIMLVHDPEDDDTPFARSAELAALRPSASIAAVSGVGHSRILSDPAALEQIADFVGARVGG